MFAPPGSKPKPVSRIMFDKFDKDKSGTIDAEGELCIASECFNLHQKNLRPCVSIWAIS